MVSEQELLDEQAYLNSILSPNQSFETSRDIFNRLARINTDLKKYK